MNKKVIYYLYCEVSLFDEEVISTLFFKDIQNDEVIEINITKNANKYNKYNIGIYYSNIEDLKKDYVVLCNENEKCIYPLEMSYEEIKKEYKLS